jgi:hypothetical protein
MRITKIHTRSWTWVAVGGGIEHVPDREEDEGDERHARDAVVSKRRGRSDEVARVVARAVGDDAGVAARRLSLILKSIS